MRLFWLLMTSVIIFLKPRISRRCDRQKTKCTGPHYVLAESCTSQTHQFAHAALLSHAVLTLVVQTHLAGFAAEAVLRRVSRQEHHMLGRRTW